MTLLDEFAYFFVRDAVEVSLVLLRVGFPFDADKVLLERDRAEGGVEVEKTGLAGDARKPFMSVGMYHIYKQTRDET